MIVELRDKMGKLDESSGAMFKEEQGCAGSVEISRLLPNEAREAIKKLPEGVTGINDRIKEALKMLGKIKLI